MPQTLADKKAELDTLYEDFKYHTTKMHEVLGAIVRATKPLMEREYGEAGVIVGLAAFGQVQLLSKEAQDLSVLGARPAN